MRYRFDRYELDTEQHTLLKDGQPVHIRPLSFQVLRFLLDHAGELVSQDQLLEAVWKRQEVSSSAVAQTIRDIRTLLQDSAQSPRFIQTEHKRGYRFVAEVQKEADDEAKPPVTGSTAPRHHGRWLQFATVIFLLAGAFLWVYTDNHGDISRRIDTQIQKGAFKEAGLLFRTALPQAQLDQAIALLQHAADQHLTLSGLELIERIKKERPEWLKNPAIIREYARLAGQKVDYALQRQLAESAYKQGNHLDPELTLELIQALVAMGEMETARKKLDALQEQVNSGSAQPELQARMEWMRARMALQQSDYARATKHLNQALQLASSPLLILKIQIDRILSLTGQQQFDAALELSNTLLKEPALQSHPYEMGRLSRERALIFLGMHKLEDALSESLAAEAQFARVEAPRDLAGMRNNTARLLARMGRIEQAETAYRDALKQFQALGDIKGEALAWSNLAVISAIQGQYHQAFDLGEKAIALFKQVQALGQVARVTFNLGHNALRAGDAPRALGYFQQAMQWYATSGQPVLQARVLTALSKTNRLMGNLEQALEQADRALAISRKANNPQGIMFALLAQAESLRLLEHYDEALLVFEKARSIAKNLQLRDWENVIEIGKAETRLNQKKYDLAQTQARMLWGHLKTQPYTDDAIHAGLVLLETQIRSGKISDANRLFNELQALLEQYPEPRLQLWLNYLEHLYKKQWNEQTKAWFSSHLRNYAFWELQQKVQQEPL